jgi:uncharacterized membrane protein YedE/YeeE
MQAILTFIAGLLFGIGLIVSGMSDPEKVIGFLDLAGNWNPSLAFVMLGAIPVSFVGMRVIERRRRTVYGEALHLPGKSVINKELMIGSALFGIGWALAGFCPGPALVALGAGYFKALFFVVMMLGGMLLHDRIYSKLAN